MFWAVISYGMLTISGLFVAGLVYNVPGTVVLAILSAALSYVAQALIAYDIDPRWTAPVWLAAIAAAGFSFAQLVQRMV